VSIVHRYLFRTIVLHTLLVMAVLLALGMFIEIAGQLDDVGTGHYGVLQMMLYVVLRLPGRAFTTLPMAALLGSLLGLGSLAARSELIALQSAGLSTVRLAASVLMTGVVLSIAGGAVGEYVAPPLHSYAAQYRGLQKFGQSGLASGRAVWIRDRNTILNITPLSRDVRFGGVYLFEMGAHGRLLGVAHADSAAVDDSGQWILNNYSETVFGEAGVTARRVRRFSQPTSLSPDLLGMTVVQPAHLGGAALNRYIRYLHSNGLDAHRFEAAFWGRLAAAAAIMPMCILALSLVLGNLRSSGAGTRMVAGIIIGLVYFLFSRSLVNGGAVYGLDTVLAAWLPTSLLTLATLLVLMRVR